MITAQQVAAAYGPAKAEAVNQLEFTDEQWRNLPDEFRQRDILRELCREQHEAAMAFRELNVCYRTGKRPSEALFKRLDKADAVLTLFEEVKSDDDEVR